ncbi:MAG: hypothetical protein EOO06_13065 [Chitinophagaceae bacterium]|nr:MAG: hypothetical protein EOO06_13065 [Chitinophagaceae bacterium]
MNKNCSARKRVHSNSSLSKNDLFALHREGYYFVAMQTPAQIIKQKMEIMENGMKKMRCPKTLQLMHAALGNARQMLANFEEVERLTKNPERLN